jgi:hypothetical protein
MYGFLAYADRESCEFMSGIFRPRVGMWVFSVASPLWLGSWLLGYWCFKSSFTHSKLTAALATLPAILFFFAWLILVLSRLTREYELC